MLFEKEADSRIKLLVYDTVIVGGELSLLLLSLLLLSSVELIAEFQLGLSFI